MLRGVTTFQPKESRTEPLIRDQSIFPLLWREHDLITSPLGIASRQWRRAIQARLVNARPSVGNGEETKHEYGMHGGFMSAFIHTCGPPISRSLSARALHVEAAGTERVG